MGYTNSASTPIMETKMNMGCTELVRALHKLTETEITILWNKANVCMEVDRLGLEVEMADENLEVTRSGGSLYDAIASILIRCDASETGNDAAIFAWFEHQIMQAGEELKHRS